MSALAICSDANECLCKLAPWHITSYCNKRYNVLQPYRNSIARTGRGGGAGEGSTEGEFGEAGNLGEEGGQGREGGEVGGGGGTMSNNNVTFHSNIYRQNGRVLGPFPHTTPTTHCNALRHTWTHCNSLQITATHYKSEQVTATHCISLHLNATHCNPPLIYWQNSMVIQPPLSLPLPSFLPLTLFCFCGVAVWCCSVLLQLVAAVCYCSVLLRLTIISPLTLCCSFSSTYIVSFGPLQTASQHTYAYVLPQQ